MRRRIIGKYFRFSIEDDKKLKYLANKSGLSESSVIRSLLDSVVLKEMPTKEFYDAIYQIRKIGININQLSHIANSTGNIYEKELNKEFKLLNEQMMKILNSYL